MSKIIVKEFEPFEAALRRFKRLVEKINILADLKEKEFYEKPTAKRKRQKLTAIKGHHKKLASQALPKRLY